MASCSEQHRHQMEKPSFWSRWTLTLWLTLGRITCFLFALWPSIMWSIEPVHSMNCQLIHFLIKTLSWWFFWMAQLSLRALPVRSGPPTSHRRSNGDTLSCQSFPAPRQESIALISPIFQRVYGSPHPTASTAARLIRTRRTTTATTLRTITSTTRWALTT